MLILFYEQEVCKKGTKMEKILLDNDGKSNGDRRSKCPYCSKNRGKREQEWIPECHQTTRTP